MKQIKHSYMVVAALAVAGLVGLQTAQAGIITGADIINGTNSYTTGDGLVTLDPLASGLVAGTLGSNGNIFGVTGGGNNNNIIDADGDPSTTADREALNVTLDATVGLSQLAVVWTRANGPLATDGIVISGFLADPGVTHSGAGTASVGYSAGSVYLDLFNWSSTPAVFDFSNLATSAGQTLQISVNDSDQAGPVSAMQSISYDVIPEPATLSLVAAMGGGLIFIRRRRRMM